MNTDELFEGVGETTESSANLVDQVTIGETPEVAPIEVRTNDNTVTGGTDTTTGTMPATVEEDIPMDGIAKFDFDGAIEYLGSQGIEDPTDDLLAHLETTYPEEYKWEEARKEGMTKVAMLEELMYHKRDIQAKNDSDFYNGVQTSLIGMQILGADIAQGVSEVVEAGTGWDMYADEEYNSFVNHKQKVTKLIRDSVENPEDFFSTFTLGQILPEMFPAGAMIKGAKVGSKLYKVRNAMETKTFQGVVYSLLGYARARGRGEDKTTSAMWGAGEGVAGVAIGETIKLIGNQLAKQGTVRAQRRFEDLNKLLTREHLTTNTKKKAFQRFLVETAEVTEDMAAGTTVSARLESPQFRSQALVQYIANTTDEGAILMYNSVAGNRRASVALTAAKQAREELLIGLSKTDNLETNAIQLLEKDWVKNSRIVADSYGRFIHSIEGIIPEDLSQHLPQELVDLAIEELGNTTLSTTRKSLGSLQKNIQTLKKVKPKDTTRVDTLTRQLEKAKANNSAPALIRKLESKIQLATKDMSSAQAHFAEGAMDNILGALSDVSTVLRKNISKGLHTKLTGVKFAIQNEIKLALESRLGTVKGEKIYKEFLNQRLAYAKMKNVETSKIGELIARLGDKAWITKKGKVSNEDYILNALHKMEIDDTTMGDMLSVVGSKGIERLNSLFIKSAIENGSIKSLSKMQDMIIKKGATPEMKLFVDTVSKLQQLFADDLPIQYGTTIDSITSNRSEVKAQAASAIVKPILVGMLKHLPSWATDLIPPLKQAILQDDIASAFKHPALIKAITDEIEHMTPAVRKQYFINALDQVPRLAPPKESTSFVAGTKEVYHIGDAQGDDIAKSFGLESQNKHYYSSSEGKPTDGSAFSKTPEGEYKIAKILKANVRTRSDKQYLRKRGIDGRVFDEKQVDIQFWTIQKGIADLQEEVAIKQANQSVGSIERTTQGEYLKTLQESTIFSDAIRQMKSDFHTRKIEVNTDEFNRMVEQQAKKIKFNIEKQVGFKVDDPNNALTKRAISIILGGM